MTRISSDMPVDALLGLLFKYRELHRQAVRRIDVPAGNRHILKVIKAGDALASTSPGRDALEKLLAHPMAYMRLRAAQSVMEWDSKIAIPVLGRLLFEDLGEESSADERIDIRTEAKETLFLHFGINSWNRNDLIEPLKAYGVDLPYRDYDKWR